VNAVMNLRVLYDVWQTLTSCTNKGFLKRVQLPEVSYLQLCLYRCFKKSFTTSKAYVHSLRGHVQCFELYNVAKRIEFVWHSCGSK
jgi:hypothetical protein